ncbi:MAG: hypothetical protein JWM31_3341, partial [Solirubrobacterales bacterium]|nr:hypothetical protein [Solirubrobacterales bacterium]
MDVTMLHDAWAALHGNADRTQALADGGAAVFGGPL